MQKRLDGSVDFFRNWADYRKGFGNLSGEFWLGLDKIHRLTSQTNNKLRVELEDFDGNTAYAEYDTFTVADEADMFRLRVWGYKGNREVWTNSINSVMLLTDPLRSVIFWPSVGATSNAQAVTTGSPYKVDRYVWKKLVRTQACVISCRTSDR